MQANLFALSPLAIAIGLVYSGQTFAQSESGTEQTEAEATSTVLEPVTVTGEFQQSLIDRIPIEPEKLPFTLDVIDRQFLDERNFTRPIEALTTLPNIIRVEDRQGTGTAFFMSRGFEAPIMVDNRPQNNFRGAGARDDSFVESYEVLKGPTSIASGPVSAGGTINTLTKSPQKDSFVDLKLRTDQFGTLSGEFDANPGNQSGSDAVMFRVSGAYRDYGFDADETERKTTAIRPVVTADLGSATSVKASVAYIEQELNPNSGFPLMSNGDIPAEIDTDTFTGFANGQGEVEDLLYEAEINHEFLDNLKLTVRGSKQDTDFDYQNTNGLYNYGYADGGPGIGVNDPYVYSYSQRATTETESTFYDAQLAYEADFWDQTQDFMIGVAHQENSFERLFSPYQTVGPIRLDQLDIPRYGATDLGPVAPFTTSDSTLKSVLAEAAIRPNDSLTIVGGVRYDDLDQLGINYRRGNAFEAPFEDDETTFRLGATVSVAEAVNLYASYAEAFTPQFGLKRNNDPVEAERSDGYELGAKGSTSNGTMTYQTGLFYTLRENVAVTDPNNGPNETFYVTVGEMRVQGFEFTGSFKPAPGLSLTANFGYTDIDVTEAGDDEVTEPVFPNVTGSFYVAYEIQSGALRGLSSGGGVRYVGERSGPYTDFDSYAVYDLNFAYPITNDIELSFDILNVTDELYLENASAFAQRMTGGSVLGAPRTAVLTLNWTLSELF